VSDLGKVCGATTGPVWKAGGEVCGCTEPKGHEAADVWHKCPCNSWWVDVPEPVATP